ncbi:MAG: hypothetical protein K0S44_2713 [Bacteroidetes bacterium]|jgi:hypothetical protein|nr:hypothetical protein [Bacteroidota bacterium]
MKNYFLILILILTCRSHFIIAQSSRDKAVADILMLKEGALLVKLKTSENLINGFIRAGKQEEADKVKAEQEATNRDIARAFSKHFNFCKVYFFYSGQSTAIKNGDLGALMNTDLEADPSFNSVNYLIGEFGESATTKIDGFIMQDRNLVQLESPFPFLIRSNKSGVISRTYDEMVIVLNVELRDFYMKKK